MRYNKPPITVDQQADLLVSRGLICDDLPRVKRYLARIGYYRLSAYWLPFEQPSSDPAKRNHNFHPGTRFDQILSLYIFDRKLRLLVLDALERIEVAVRTAYAREMSLAHGAHAHLNNRLYKDQAEYRSGLTNIEADLRRSHETFVRHYQQKYNDPTLPPIWAVVETMSFGTISRWVANTNDTNVKKLIMKSLGMPTINVMEQVLHTLTPVRNDCAHHSRLWNRRYTMAPPTIEKIGSRLVSGPQKYYLFNYLVIIEYLLAQINPGSQWKSRLVSLLGTLEPRQLSGMGFPDDWQNREPWNGGQA
jgi:abortive infection bacteriophage resistance protein